MPHQGGRPAGNMRLLRSHPRSRRDPGNQRDLGNRRDPGNRHKPGIGTGMEPAPRWHLRGQAATLGW
jgi:hypothetical protein